MSIKIVYRSLLHVLVVITIILQSLASISPSWAREIRSSDEMINPISSEAKNSSMVWVETARQQTDAQRARPEPSPIPNKLILPPGTISALPAPGNTLYRVYLPLVISQQAQREEIALDPDAWMQATEEWESITSSNYMWRYPSLWSVDTQARSGGSDKTFSFKNASGGSVIRVSYESNGNEGRPAQEEPTFVADYRQRGYAVQLSTVKGLRAWQFRNAIATDVCEEVVLDLPGSWMRFQLLADNKTNVCPDTDTFDLMLSSFQIVMNDPEAAKVALLPLPDPASVRQRADRVNAIAYNRTAAYNYQYNYTPSRCTSGSCSNDDGYRASPDGAHYPAHVLQAGGFPIHWNAGQNNSNAIVINITQQRNYFVSLIPQINVTARANMQVGDYIHMTNGTCGWASVVMAMSGGIPYISTHSTDFWNLRYDSVNCGTGTGYEFWHIDDSADPKLNSGLSLNPTTQQTNANVAASFNVHNYGGQAINLSLRVTTNGGGDFTTTSCNLPVSGDCSYSQTRSFASTGSYNTCAQMDTGSGWQNVPVQSGMACQTMNIVTPADVRLSAALQLTPNTLNVPGGPVSAQFSVQNYGGTAATEQFRARVDNSTVVFDPTGNISLSPNQTYPYTNTKTFTQIGTYTVTAEHYLNSVWTPLINGITGYIRVMAPPPSPEDQNKGNSPSNGNAGEPVNTATGNYFYSVTDISDPTPGLAQDVTRWYNALDANKAIGSFGYGTSWTYNMTVTWRADKTAIVRMPDGHLAYFVGAINSANPGDLTGPHQGQGTDIGTLTRAADGTAVLKLPDQTTYTFDATGKLVRVSDSHPSQIDVVYSGGRATQLIHSGGVTYTLAYTGANIGSIASSTGRMVTYTYSPAGDLIGVIRPDGSTYTYTYDANHRLTDAYDPNGHRYLQNVYDAQGRVVVQYDQARQQSTFTYGPVITSTRTFADALGNVITHTYDSKYRLISTIDTFGYVMTYTYNAQSQVIARRDKNGFIWKYTYDAQGNKLSETDPLARTWSYTYDNRNNLLTKTDPLSNTWSYQYDANNRQIQATDPAGNKHYYAYDSGGNLIWEKDEAGAQTWREYDALGQPSVITDALGGVTRMAYDDFGNRTVYTDTNGHVAHFFYDDGNRLVKTIDPAGTAITLTYDAAGNLLTESDGMGHLKYRTYDIYNRLIAETDFGGSATHYAYDVLGRKAVMTDALGYTTVYTYDAVGNLSARQEKNGAVTHFEYDAEGHLTREVDALGRATEYTYDASGRQTTVRRPCDACADGFAVSQTLYGKDIDPRGAITHYRYDVLGRVAVITDALGFATTKTYDPAGRLLQEVNALGAVTRYGYDLLGRLITTTNPLGYQVINRYDGVGNLLQTINERGYTTTYQYDAKDRVVATTDALGNVTLNTYDPASHLLSKVDLLGHVTSYTYDPNDNPLTETDPLGRTKSTGYNALNQTVWTLDALGHRSYTRYDAQGQVVSETNALGYTTLYTYNVVGQKIAESTPLGYTTVFTSDSVNNIVARREPTGAVWCYTFDANGNQLSQINPLGQTQTTDYDLLNRPVKETDALGASTRHQYNAVGQEVAVTDPHGAVTRSQYDAAGQKVRETNALGYTRVFTLDAVGNQIATQDERGSVSQTIYDGLNRPIAQIDPLGNTRYTLYNAAGQTQVTLDANGNATTYQYDAAGNAIQVTDALSHTTTTTFNALNQAISVTDALGHARAKTYDALGHLIQESTALGYTTVYTYNLEGWQIAQRDPVGQVWHTAHDAAGRTIQETDPLGRIKTTEYDLAGQLVAQTDALNRTLHYAFDPVGRKTAVIGPDGIAQHYTYDPVGNILTDQDGNGHITRYEYDLLNHLIRKTDALGKVWLYRYDAGGNQTATLTPAGHVITQTFDAAGHLSVKYTDGVQAVAFAYDANGNRQVMTDTIGTTTYTYDALNHLVTSADPAGRVGQSVYDAAGQRIKAIYPDNSITQYTYTADGGLVQITDPGGGVTTYMRDALGRPLHVVQANGVTVDTSYDVVGNVLAITQRDAQGQVFAAQQFTIDAANRRAQVVETLPQGTLTTVYTYDDVDRLTDSVASDGTETYYAFDQAGNRTAQWGRRNRSGVVENYRITYTYNALNQLVRAVDTALGVSTYLYDADGNRTTTTWPDQRARYQFDAESHLVEAHVEIGQTGGFVHKNGAYEQYKYDGAGRRAQRSTVSIALGSVVARRDYRYDDLTGWDVLKAYDTAMTTSEQGFVSDQPLHKLAFWQNGQSGFFQNNALGSVLGHTDSTGNAPNAMLRYGDYGEEGNPAAAASNQAGYTGYERDTYTGLNYARSRYYEAATGTFLTIDPFAASRDTLLDLHRYLYVRANPINQTDPFGLFSVPNSAAASSFNRLTNLAGATNQGAATISGTSGNSTSCTSANCQTQVQLQNAQATSTSSSSCGQNCGFYYTVVSGDWLAKIAKKLSIPDWHYIYYHPSNYYVIGSNPNLIYPGQKFYIPCPNEYHSTPPGGSSNPPGNNPPGGNNPPPGGGGCGAKTGLIPTSTEGGGQCPIGTSSLWDWDYNPKYYYSSKYSSKQVDLLGWWWNYENWAGSSTIYIHQINRNTIEGEIWAISQYHGINRVMGVVYQEAQSKTYVKWRCDPTTGVIYVEQRDITPAGALSKESLVGVSAYFSGDVNTWQDGVRTLQMKGTTASAAGSQISYSTNASVGLGDSSGQISGSFSVGETVTINAEWKLPNEMTFTFIARRH